jgi:Flp pilus assembly protein TadD
MDHIKPAGALVFMSLLLGACATSPQLDDATAHSRQESCTSLAGGSANDKHLASADQIKLIDEGKAYFRQGEYGLAEQRFRKATELTSFGKAGRSKSANLEAWLGLAASYDKLKRFDLSDPIYDHIRSEFGKSAVYHNNYGYSLELRGEVVLAQAQFEAARALDPVCLVAQNNLTAVSSK